VNKPLIDLVEDLDQIDQFHVVNKEKDDDGEEHYYCWLNKKPENLERMKAIYGYEILGAKHKESALVPPNAVGERVNGDLVLARLTHARYEKLMAMKERKNANRIASANENWKGMAESAGLKVDDSTKQLSETLKVK